jgi:hypothetical protein
MIEIQFSAKALRFTLSAIDHQVAAHHKEIELPTTGDDRRSDLSNDAALLNAVAIDLRRKLEEFESQFPPLGDARARIKLRKIIHCLHCDGFSEEEQDALINMGSKASPDSSWTNYIYWPDRYGLDGSIEGALDKIFSYQTIRL